MIDVNEDGQSCAQSRLEGLFRLYTNPHYKQNREKKTFLKIK